MELRKWASNDSRLLLSIPSEYHCNQTLLSWDTTDHINALGNKACFKFRINFEIPGSSTKRMILSSRLFDPLGLIAPVIISVKIILKEVSMAKTRHADGTQAVLDWDDAVPDNIAERWREFRNNLLRIGEISIDRWILYTPSSIS